MTHLPRTLLIVSLLMWCSTRLLFADEADELRQRVQALREDAARLAEQGQREPAEQRQREAQKLLEALQLQAAKSGSVENPLDREIAARQERLQQLAQENERLSASGASKQDRARMKEAIAHVQQEMEELQAARKQQFLNVKGPHPEGQPDVKHGLEEAGRRIQHLRAAAENLQAAGADDLARQLIKQAKSMEQEVRRTKEMISAQMAEQSGREHPEGDIEAQLTELRQEVRRLRAEVGELRQQINKP